MLKRKYKSESNSNLSEFFQKHIQIIKHTSAECAECGCKLFGNIEEVAHILPKQYFKSISAEDLNIIYLCGQYSENNCHGKYDNSSNEIVRQMNIFKSVSESFEKLQELITEKLNYKHYDRWQVLKKH